MDKIRVVVSGTGYMGREVLAGLAREDDFEPVGAIEKLSSEETISLPENELVLPLSADPVALIAQTKPRVVIDFTNAAWTPDVARAALDYGASLVIGTTGLAEAFVDQLTKECRDKGIGAVIAPNFAIGAVLMVHLAKIAAQYFDYAEITEMHQEKKADAPSGTALFTALEMAKARGRPFERTSPDKEPIAGSRGAELEGISIHSQRMPGFVAHQEVVFGGLGQTLRIRHDSTGRESFIPGVLLATREVLNRRELVVGLDKLIGL